jgi:hypothetical protein
MRLVTSSRRELEERCMRVHGMLPNKSREPRGQWTGCRNFRRKSPVVDLARKIDFGIRCAAQTSKRLVRRTVLYSLKLTLDVANYVLAIELLWSAGGWKWQFGRRRTSWCLEMWSGRVQFKSVRKRRARGKGPKGQREERKKQPTGKGLWTRGNRERSEDARRGKIRI